MKKVLVSLGIMIMMLCGVAGLVVPAAEVYAADAKNVCNDASVKSELKKAAGCSDFGNTKKTAVPIALNIINVVLTFTGLLAVGVIVYGGITYATSVGDASKIHKAKNSILYGVVGLVVSVMAFAIVAFVNTSILKK